MYKMYINGKCVEGAGDKLDVTCPATGELLETITTASIQQRTRPWRPPRPPSPPGPA